MAPRVLGVRGRILGKISLLGAVAAAFVVTLWLGLSRTEDVPGLPRWEFFGLVLTRARSQAEEYSVASLRTIRGAILRYQNEYGALPDALEAVSLARAGYLEQIWMEHPGPYGWSTEYGRAGKDSWWARQTARATGESFVIDQDGTIVREAPGGSGPSLVVSRERKPW